MKNWQNGINPTALTPVWRLGDLWVKRDDLFEVRGVCGGKVRAALLGAQRAGARGIVSCGARQSTASLVLGAVAQEMGVGAAYFTASGPTTRQLDLARNQYGVDVRRVAFGRISVLRARARSWAKEVGWWLLPFGGECPETVETTRAQAANLPPPGEFSRLVVCVGTSMSLAGILWGLADQGIHRHPVLGVRVGSLETEKRLDRFAPAYWRDHVTLTASPLDFFDETPETWIRRKGANGGEAAVELDSMYKAKVIPSLLPGDLLWVIARRPAARG